MTTLSSLSRYRKSAIAVVGAVATWGATASLDGTYSTPEWWGLAVAVCTALGVYGVRNVTPEDEPYDPTVSEAEHGPGAAAL